MFAFSSIKHALFVFHLPVISACCPSVFLRDHLFSVQWTALPLLYLVHPLSQITNHFLARMAPVCPCKQCPISLPNRYHFKSAEIGFKDEVIIGLSGALCILSSSISYFIQTAYSEICHHVLLLIMNFIHFQLYIARCIPEAFWTSLTSFSFCFALDHFISSSYRC
jgi:hypothetical protein